MMNKNGDKFNYSNFVAAINSVPSEIIQHVHSASLSMSRVFPPEFIGMVSTVYYCHKCGVLYKIDIFEMATETSCVADSEKMPFDIKQFKELTKGLTKEITHGGYLVDEATLNSWLVEKFL